VRESDPARSPCQGTPDAIRPDAIHGLLPWARRAGVETYPAEENLTWSPLRPSRSLGVSTTWRGRTVA
jgi:hypothetical protein